MSTDILLSDPCVVFALRRESMFFRREQPYQQHFPGAPCSAQFRGPVSRAVLMLETGVGAAAMEAALRWCLSEPCFGEVPYRPRLVLSAGFSGALQADLRVGDLILATEIVEDVGRAWPVTWPAELPAGWERANLRHGRLLCSAHLVGEPLEKKLLGQKHQALAVDMETAIAARLCHERRIPFGCLRVISDDVNTPLSPYLLDLPRKSRGSPLRLAGSLLCHPTLLPEVWRLAGQTRKAAERLSALTPLLWR